MGHCVTGLIGSASELKAFASMHSLHSSIDLNANLAILPLRDQDLDSFLKPLRTGYMDGFEYLSEQLMQMLAGVSLRHPILYFETDYFGGAGSQGAVVFRDGIVAYGPKRADIGPINEALRLMGVRVVRPARDEFETLGLNRHRDTNDWLELGDE